MTLRVVVIGAGIIGALSAIEAVRDGHEVIIVEPGKPGGEQAASYGNAAWISEGTVMPVSTPGLWRKIPGYLLDPGGPFAIRWRYLPQVLPWLARFVNAGSNVAKVEAIAHARRTLVKSAVGRYQALAQEAGVSSLVRRQGLMYVYPSRSAFEAESLEWDMRRRLGVEWDEWEGETLHDIEPGLGGFYQFGARLKDGAHLSDPGAFVAAMVDRAVKLGATVHRTKATGFRVESGRLVAVITSNGEILCDRALICAGIHSQELARQAGDDVPLETERGYHVVIADPEYVPHHPVMPSDGKMGLTMTEAGLRVAGQVELGGVDAAPDWRRADILLDHLARVFPAVGRDPARVKKWMGHRPSTPDGLPCLGLAFFCADIIYGFGHGHSGICMAPVSARLLVDVISGTPPVIDPAPFSAERFR